jgi:catechol 2,3-dioxygenase-like lactoylglutathione lyase family enzyme
MTAVTASTQFDLRGYNHIALVCSDMQNTVDFYEGVLGFPLVKTLELGGHGQHFFFQVTENDGVAFFWFNDVEPPAPGIAGADWFAGEMTPSSAKGLSGKSAVGSMHHLSFDVPHDQLEEYHRRLAEAGVEVSDIIVHTGEAGEEISAFYFRDPDGIVLEFSAWGPKPESVTFEPTTAADALSRRTGKVAITI